MILILLATLISAPIGNCEESFHTIKLRLKWRHQFQSAGYYVAVHKGFYRNNNLEVIISEAELDEEPINLVLSGESHFAISSPGIITHRMRGRSVVALAAIFQRSPLVLITQHKESFLVPPGLSGSKIMIEPGSEELEVFLAENKIPLSGIQKIPHNNAVENFVNGKIDGFTAYTTDEIYQLDKLNVNYIAHKLSVPGTEYYSDILFTSQDMIEQNPAVVRAFRRASLQGWEYAFNNIEETVALIQEKYKVSKTKEELVFEAQAMSKYALTDGVELGEMDPKRWSQIAARISDAGVCPYESSISGFVFGETFRSKRRGFQAALASALFVFCLTSFVLASDKTAKTVRKIFQKEL